MSNDPKNLNADHAVLMESLEPRLLLSAYYIATNGSDSNAGTLAAPLASLGKFLTLAKPGDTAFVEGGTYNGSSSGWSNLQPKVSGTASAPITIQNYDGQKVIIDAGASASSTDFVDLTNGQSYLTFQGLSLSHFRIGFNIQGSTAASHIVMSDLDIGYGGSYPSGSQNGWGMFLNSGAHDILISDSVIHNIAGAGIQMDYVNNVTIQNTQIHDTTGDSGSDGIVVDPDSSGRYATNLTVTGVTVWNVGDDGIDIKADGVKLADDVVYATGHCGYKLWSPTSTQQGTFTVDNCVGYGVPETVIRGVNAPNLTITNSSFLGQGSGESTFIYTSGQSWTGKLTLQNDKFYYNGKTTYAAAADIQKQNTVLNMDNDQYYNSTYTSNGLIMRNGSSATTYGNAAFSNGSFYSAQGQEKNGQSVQQDIAPYLVTANVPTTASAGTAASFSAAGGDPEGSTLTYSWNFGDGTTANGATATHTYASGGTYAVTAIVSDGTLQTKSSQNITVSGTAVNLPPAATNDSAATTANHAVVTPNVLANDSDPNGQTLSVTGFTQAAHGTVVNNGNGTFTYTPASNWTGSDAFTYTISDSGGLTAKASVNITVGALAPAANNDSATTTANHSVVTPNVLANDSDPNGQTLSVTAFTQAAHGTVVNNGDGTFTYTPASNWTGSDAFTYTVSDTGGLTTKASVNITVGALAPVANNDSATTTANHSVVTPNVLANDSDPNGQTISVTAFTQAAHGTVVNNGDGTFTYTPASNWTGSDAFTYTVSDTGGLTTKASVNITVAGAVGNLPPVANNDSATTTANHSVVTPNVLANDSDPNGQTLSVTAFGQAAHGTVVNNGDGTFTYTPASNWTGSDSFTYTVSDTGGLSSKASVNIAVNALPAAGQSYYIATNGSDSNAGTLAAPLATLGKFFAMAKPGDTAFIEGGTYSGSSSGWSNLQPKVSGTASAPITIQNYDGQKVIIDAGASAASSRDFVDLMNGQSYLTFEGLSLSHFRIGFNIQGSSAASHIVMSNLDIGYDGSYPSTAQDGWGIFLNSGAHDILISDSVIHNVAGAGIQMDYVNNVTIQNTQVHDTTGGSGSDGIVANPDSSGRWATNVTLIGDTVWNVGDDGFDFKASNVTFTNCLAYGAVCDYKLWSPTTSQQGTFTLNNDSGYAASETVVRAVRAPNLTITNSSFVNAGKGESTFIYDGGQAWKGKLTLQNDKFYYNGTTSYAVAADIQKQNAVLNMDYDQYYNSGRTSAALVMRNGSSATTYGNAAFNNGSFYKAQGQELHGQGVQQNIAPLYVASSVPTAASAGTASTFSVTAKDPENKAVTYKWTFGDGTSAVSGASVKHTYAAAGTYTVTMVASDGSQSSSLSKTVIVGRAGTAAKAATGVVAAPLAMTTASSAATVGTKSRILTDVGPVVDLLNLA